MNAPPSLSVAERVQLREAFVRLIPQSDVTAERLYERLFELAPEVRPLFPDAMDEQREKVIRMLAMLVDAIDHSDRFVEMCQVSAIQHRGYGVRSEHFAPLGIALLGAIAETSVPSASTDEMALWARLYELVVFHMIGQLD